MKTVPRPTTSSVLRGWNESSTCMRHPVSRLRCVANESPWMWNSGRTLTSTSSGVNRQHACQRPQAGGEVGVGVHDALGPAGRARAVEHQARGVAVDRRARRAGPPGRPRPRASGSRARSSGSSGSQRLDDRPLVLAGHHDPRAAVLEEVPQLVGGEPRVQRQGDRRRRRASPGGPPGTAASPAVTIATRSPGSTPSRRNRAAHRRACASSSP